MTTTSHDPTFLGKTPTTNMSDTPQPSHATMHTTSPLESLPLELLDQICSYLFPTHDPMRGHTRTSQNDDRSFDPETPSHRIQEPLNCLAASSRTLLNAVESFSRTLLLRWQPMTKFRTLIPPTAHLPPKLQTAVLKIAERIKLSHRGDLLRWRNSHCVWCGKKSLRKAVLCTGLGCCAKCDKLHWADKITKTKAKKEYNLLEHQLLPLQAGLKVEFGVVDGVPVIGFGTYMVEGTVATMFLRGDVERVADAVHGDWKVHMAERREKAGKRKKRKGGVVDLTGDE